MSTQATSKVDVIKKHFSLLCDLRRLYKIEIVTDERSTDPVINYQLANIETITSYLEFLRDELSVYPPSLVNKLQLDRIILCEDLRKLKRPVCGCASMALLFADNLALRMLLSKKNTIYLDVAYGGTADGLVTVHHELFHATEAHGNNRPPNLDEDWPRLNPSTFLYEHEVSEYAAKRYPLDVDGFLTDISMQSAREDQAELFSHMIVNMARVEQFAEKDKYLQAKVARMKQIMHSFSSEFNAQFWKARREKSIQGLPKYQYDNLLLKRLR